MMLLAALAALVAVELQSNHADEVAVTHGGAAAVVVGGYKLAKFEAPGDRRALSVRVKGSACDLTYALPGPLDSFADETSGVVRLYLAHDFTLYTVPFGIEMETPAEYLRFRQPPEFPLLPSGEGCKLK